jgi:hypothetical protein
LLTNSKVMNGAGQTPEPERKVTESIQSSITELIATFPTASTLMECKRAAVQAIQEAEEYEQWKAIGKALVQASKEGHLRVFVSVRSPKQHAHVVLTGTRAWLECHFMKPLTELGYFVKVYGTDKDKDVHICIAAAE